MVVIEGTIISWLYFRGRLIVESSLYRLNSDSVIYCIYYLRHVQIKLELNQPLGIGEAFGVRRPGAAFPVLDHTNVQSDFDGILVKRKAGKAAPGRRTPKASPNSRYLLAFNRLLFAGLDHRFGHRRNTDAVRGASAT